MAVGMTAAPVGTAGAPEEEELGAAPEEEPLAVSDGPAVCEAEPEPETVVVKLAEPVTEGRSELVRESMYDS